MIPMRRAVPWLGVLFIVAIVGLAVFDSVRGYRSAVDDTGRELDTQARILAEQTARSLQAVDVVLRHLAEQHRQGSFNAMSPRELHHYLREQAVGLVQIEGLLLLRPDGTPVGTSITFPLPQPTPNVSGFALFQNMKAGAQGLQIGDALKSDVDQQWVFPITRRLETATGEFAGAVGARGRIEYFQTFYRDIQLDPGTKATLVHRNGTLLARYPPAEASLGKRFALIDEVLAAAEAGREGPTRTVSPVDGVDRFGAVQIVPNYPLAVLVTRDAEVALAPWRGQAVRSVARMLALAALAGLLLALVSRQLTRLGAAQASLEAARDRFSLAVAGSDDGIWDWDRATGQLFSSARAREILGIAHVPESEPADRWFASLRIHPDDEPRRRAAFDDHLAGKVPAYEVELRVRHPDSSYRWAGVRGVCVRDASGRPQRMAGSVSDIDARKRAEEGLRQSEERFALAVAGSNDGVVDWDIVNDRMFTSIRAMRIAGVDSNVTTRTRAEWVALLRLHPDDAARYDDDFQRHLAGETEVREGEYRVQHADGSYRWVRVRGTSVRDAQGRAIRWAGSVSDVDEQKRTEQALRQSEERYQLAVAGSNEGLWDWDLKRDLLFLSPRAQTLMGWQPGESLLPRREWIARSTYHPEDIAHVRQAISAHLHGSTPHFEVEYRLQHRSGEWHWYRQRGVAVRDERGQPYRMAGSMEDISRRRHAEDERERLEKQLRQAQKLEAIGTLAGGIAHDFNNILAAILGYGEMAQKGAAEGSAMRRHIDAALSAGMRAKSLVERILAFSRSGVGERVPVHVQSVVAEALELVAASLPHGVALEHDLAAGDAALMGDPTQIHQVVMNLCANAVQAMKGAGTLSVIARTVRFDEPRMLLTTRAPIGDYVQLRVADTGIGMPAQVLERIFDPFFTTKEVGVGTGLGLSLVHGIVTDLGGGIDVQSAPSHGSTFTVYLPWQRGLVAAVATGESVPHGEGETVLLVDDEEPLVRLGEEVLAELGYEPVGFSSSLAALASFRATPQRFAIVVSDEAMPDMTGSELAREIRRIRPDIPIVLMSGYVTHALTLRARDAGVVEVLAKPLVQGEIARSLAGALRG